MCYAVSWCGVVYVVNNNKLLGKALGVIVCLMNLGFGIMPLVIGILREYFENYIYS
jgi:hypothetical protein